MVKLSRISLGFLTLPGLAFLLSFWTTNAGSTGALFARADFLGTRGATVFFAVTGVAWAVVAALLPADLVATGAAALTVFVRESGLALTAPVAFAADVADFDLSVLMDIVYFFIKNKQDKQYMFLTWIFKPEINLSNQTSKTVASATQNSVIKL